MKNVPGTCPGCGKHAAATPDNRWRPFCSERCKMTDLGLWFAERYTIPEDDGTPTPPAGGRDQ